MKDFTSWVSRCVDFVKKHGLSECDNFTDEVIFAMEEGAERCLSDYEKQLAVKIIEGV